jgi:cell wall integrity and stress response component
MPTSIPTVRPTASPTALKAPTPVPSEQNSDTVTFQSNFTIDGVAQPFLDYNGSVALEETTAATLGFPSSSCSTTGASVLGGVGRRLRFVRRIADAGFTLIATVQTTVALSATSYSSVDALYSNVTATLLRQVENGVFTANLRVTALALDASDLYSADVRNVAVSSVPAVQGQDDEGSSDGLSAGAVAGIVLGAMCAIIVGAYCIHQRSAGPKQASARVKKSLRVSLLMGTLSGSTKPYEGQTV